MAFASVLLVGVATACDIGVKLVGPAAANCASDPLFTVMPVALTDISSISVFGGLDAPGHTLPTAHAGIFLRTEGATVFAPSDMQITKVRRATYVASPNRQGKTDYSTQFNVCKQISGHFGHLTTLSASIPIAAGKWKACESYSTAIETIETCEATLEAMTVSAGQPIGTSGLSIALGLMALDFGLYDSRVSNPYIARWRHPEPTFTAVCVWDKFAPSLRDALYSKLRDQSRPIAVPGGQPRCGTMVIDVAGTASGVWALPSETRPLQGNETGYVALANYPYRPEDELALSIGPSALGGGRPVVRRANSGRVNRAFEQVTNDGLIYCYGPDVNSPGWYWFLQLTGPKTLSMRNVRFSAVDLCQTPMATWTMVGATALVR